MNGTCFAIWSNNVQNEKLLNSSMYLSYVFNVFNILNQLEPKIQSNNNHITYIAL